MKIGEEFIKIPWKMLIIEDHEELYEFWAILEERNQEGRVLNI